MKFFPIQENVMQDKISGEEDVIWGPYIPHNIVNQAKLQLAPEMWVSDFITTESIFSFKKNYRMGYVLHVYSNWFYLGKKFWLELGC